MSKAHKLTVATEAEVKQAQAAVRQLERFLRRPRRMRVRPEGAGAEGEVVVPAIAARLLVEMLGEMARGNAVVVLPAHAELTTQQAADTLNVSRPYLIKLLDEGRIPFRKVGNRRKVRLADLLAHKRKDDAEREAAADALVAEAERLGLGY